MTKTAILALLISFGGLIAALWVSNHAFEHIPYLEDELAYTYQAQLFARGDVYLRQPDADLRRMFWKPFVINCNDTHTAQGLNCQGKLFSKYPPGWSAVLASGYWMGMAWAVNPLIFLLSIALTYRLGKEIFDVRVGIIAALLLASSPIAWIQSGSFMSHSLALGLVLIFSWAMWRIEVRGHWWWGIVGGVALGWLFATRPSVAVSVAVPFVLYSGLRIGIAGLRARWNFQLVWWGKLLILLAALLFATVLSVWAINQLRDPSEKSFPNWPVWPVLAISGLIALQMVWFTLNPPIKRQNPPLVLHGFGKTLLPLLILAFVAIGLGSIHFLYNWITTGDPTQNLYQLVWEYDRLGFGEDHGRSGHSWTRAKRNLNWDMDCYARDLFGWVQMPDNAPNAPVTGNRCAVGENAGLSWLFLPLVFIFGWQRRWVWLFGLVCVSVVFSTMFYWINAGDYSARYYYEMTAFLAILSAAGVVHVADLVRPFRLQPAIYAIVCLLVGTTIIGYGPDRIEKITRLTEYHRQQYHVLEQMRIYPEKDVLIISYGEYDTWREISALMALTSPYLDSEYVLARDRYNTVRDRLLEMFPNREVIYHYNGQFTHIYNAEELVPVGG
ncbi:MAG: hypothetical protein CUN55_05375 [Phototrophicales bacterium]|nr:MAG: hypothetical protein CUN55_05375 [Phototrophicales bacterium]